MSQSVRDPNWLSIPLYSGQTTRRKDSPPRIAQVRTSAFGGNLPDLVSPPPADEVRPAPSPGRKDDAPPTQGVLVIGLGDENHGDRAIGLHLLSCLERMDWPVNVTFRQAGEGVHRLADRFRHVVVLDAIEGAATPGSLYQAGPEELTGAVAEQTLGLGLLALLSPAARRRLSIFGVHPGTTRWGSPMSMDVLSSVPILLSFLRARILEIVAEHGSVN